MKTLYGTLLQPRSADQCTVAPRTTVQIGSDGRIAEVAQRPATGRDVCGDDACWILPGFIDAHLHLPQWDRRGIDGLDLAAWHEQVVYPAEARFEDPAVAEKLTEAFVTHMIANGTTTVAAFGSPFAPATDRSFAVFARRGYRAIHGMMLNDQACPPSLRQDPDKALDESRALAAKWHGGANGRLSYAFSPRTPIACSEGIMRGAAALSEMLHCYVQTHLAESLAVTRAARETFPDRVDEVDVFADFGLLNPRTLLGHGVFLSQQQRQQVARSKTAVIHCPTANLFLESGVMDYVAHRAAGVRMALGSSIAGGHDPFMPRVAVECLQTARGLKMHAVPRRNYALPSAAEAWWILTRGAAQALSLDQKIGAVETGLEADCLVVRPESWIADLPPEQQISALLYTITPGQIEHVFIAGQRVGP